MKGMRNPYNIFIRNHFEDSGIARRVILKWILEKQ
jgi:hypothetical protein